MRADLLFLSDPSPRPRGEPEADSLGPHPHAGEGEGKRSPPYPPLGLAVFGAGHPPGLREPGSLPDQRTPSSLQGGPSPRPHLRAPTTPTAFRPGWGWVGSDPCPRSASPASPGSGSAGQTAPSGVGVGPSSVWQPRPSRRCLARRLNACPRVSPASRSHPTRTRYHPAHRLPSSSLPGPTTHRQGSALRSRRGRWSRRPPARQHAKVLWALDEQATPPGGTPAKSTGIHGPVPRTTEAWTTEPFCQTRQAAATTV